METGINAWFPYQIVNTIVKSCVSRIFCFSASRLIRNHGVGKCSCAVHMRLFVYGPGVLLVNLFTIGLNVYGSQDLTIALRSNGNQASTDS